MTLTPDGLHPDQLYMQPPTVPIADAWAQQGSLPLPHPSATAAHVRPRVPRAASHEPPGAASSGAATRGAAPGTTGTVGGSVVAGVDAQPGSRDCTPGGRGRPSAIVDTWLQAHTPAGAGTTAPDDGSHTDGVRRAPRGEHPDTL